MNMQLDDDWYYFEGSYYNNQEQEVLKQIREYFIDDSAFNDFVNSSDFDVNKIAKILNI